MNYKTSLIWAMIPVIPALIYVYIKKPEEDGSVFGLFGFFIFSLLDVVFRK